MKTTIWDKFIHLMQALETLGAISINSGVIDRLTLERDADDEEDERPETETLDEDKLVAHHAKRCARKQAQANTSAKAYGKQSAKQVAELTNKTKKWMENYTRRAKPKLGRGRGKAKRGFCAKCKTSRALKLDGTTQHHSKSRPNGLYYTCRGSGQPPMPAKGT